MNRVLYSASFGALFLLVGLVLGMPAMADVTQEQDVKGKVTTLTYHFTLTPAQEASPAFRYRLTVPPSETIPGNAITHYLRADGEGGIRRPLETAKKEVGDVMYDWAFIDMAASDINMDDMKRVTGYFDELVEAHLKRATLCREADWGLSLETLRGEEAIKFLLPSVQQSRSMSRILAMRTRFAILEGRYEDAIEQMRINYTLGRNVNELGLLVSSLVGVAEVGITNEGMKLLIAAKDSPNMYWALAGLPEPVISLEKAVAYESGLGPRVFYDALNDVETVELTEEQWVQRLEKTTGVLLNLTQLTSRSPVDNDKLTNQAAMLGMVMLSYDSAKKRLIASGMESDKVAAMPVAQVVLIDAKRELQRHSNAVEKDFHVPFYELEKLNDTEQSLKKAVRKSLGAMIANLVAPATRPVRRAQARVQAEVNALMLVEAIRNHLATEGEFPKTLGQIKLPVRRNPYTGKAYSYRLENEAAIIEFGDGQPLKYKYVLKTKK